MKARTVLIFLALGIMVQGVLVSLQFRQIANKRNEARQQTCIGISKLDNTLIELIRNSEKSLPTLKYYKDNPSDLVHALSADEHAITVLTPPKYC